ncbi:Ger(x)C family spore germination protein [Paenibacillus sp. PL91]|uniref:Ger(x)C family spore germination protein n=1 Tax=Paenibacillus sp. PL91 TaxID=2729538 RepID=UPI00145FB757|nr:Ger(x)C family spore germination protein [Paenibacillus sp. PL91]MBC9202058.1 Ger(x)C family spore germination protein [Paenibacillus sp. PL91]
MSATKWLAAAMIGACFIMTGCKGSMELNELHIVHTVAMDKGKNGNIRLTAEIAKLTTGGQQPRGMQEKTFFLTSEGRSLFEAARLMRAKSDRTLLWGHTSAIIFSADLARQGIDKQFEDMRRLRQFRNSTLIYAIEGKADEVLKVSMPNVTISSQALRGLSEGGEATALTHPTTLLDVYQGLINRYKDINIPAIEIAKDQVDKKLKLLQTKGLFAFRGARLVGFMHAPETKGYLRASGLLTGSSEAIACGPKQALVFENINSRSAIQAKANAQLKPEITINVYADLNLTGVQCADMKVDTEAIVGWEKELNQNIANEINRFIQFSKKNKVDLLGVGEMIHRKQPKFWIKMKGDWENIYPQAKFVIEVHTRIDHTNFTMG